MNKSVKRCINCCISENFPGIKFDSEGVCNLCNKFEPSTEISLIEKNRTKIANVISEGKKISTGTYDVIVAYSGGKDSTYTLHYLREEFDLKILAYLVDNDFVAEQAMINARTCTSALGIDFLIFKPDTKFMHKMYNTALSKDLYTQTQLSRANPACLTCINLINNLVLNEAVLRKIPIIAGGYIGGQIPSQAGIVKSNVHFLNEYKDKNKKFLMENIDQRFEQYLDIAAPSETQVCPTIINPLLGIKYNEDDVIKTISKYGWTKPKNTGKSSSNCLLNDYAISVHSEKYGFHSYEAEICLQVRSRTMTKEIALDKLEDIKASIEHVDVRQKLEN